MASSRICRGCRRPAVLRRGRRKPDRTSAAAAGRGYRYRASCRPRAARLAVPTSQSNLADCSQRVCIVRRALTVGIRQPREGSIEERHRATACQLEAIEGLVQHVRHALEGAHNARQVSRDTLQRAATLRREAHGRRRPSLVGLPSQTLAWAFGSSTRRKSISGYAAAICSRKALNRCLACTAKATASAARRAANSASASVTDSPTISRLIRARSSAALLSALDAADSCMPKRYSDQPLPRMDLAHSKKLRPAWVLKPCRPGTCRACCSAQQPAPPPAGAHCRGRAGTLHCHSFGDRRDCSAVVAVVGTHRVCAARDRLTLLVSQCRYRSHSKLPHTGRQALNFVRAKFATGGQARHSRDSRGCGGRPPAIHR
jgi:hypothetical protein